MEKRIEWVDVYKGVLILLVVLAHSLQEVYKVCGLDFTSDGFRNMIYSFHMPAFMAMSGYLVYRPALIGEGKLGCIPMLYKRAKQLIVPLLIWSVPLSIAKDINYIDILLYPNDGYWFLWALFFIIVIYNFVDLLCHKIHLNQEIGMIATAGALTGIQMVLPNAKILGYEYIAYYFLFYLMGYYANKYKDYLPEKSWIIWCIFAIWFVMACFWTPNDLPFFLKGISFVPSKLLQLVYRMLTPVVFIVWMFSTAPKMKVGDSCIWKMLIEFGQISLGIYVAHMVVKKLFAHILLDTLPMLPIWVHVVIEFVLLLILSWVVVKLIMMNKYSAKWILGKA